jgi:large subunit ribosomal protein L4
MQADLMNAKGENVGKIDLKEDLFGAKVSKEFLHEYVTIYLANQRQGDAHTKTRAEVSGGGKKPWKQKHTGRARAGSTRSPLWRHGGVTFGPRRGKVRSEMPRKKAQAALVQALAAKQASGDMIFVDNLAIFEKNQVKTKEVAALLKKIGCTKGRTMIVLDSPDAKLSLAARNIADVAVALAADLNAYTVLQARKIVLTKPALDKLASRVN